MAEEILNDSLPDLKELENKVGRKTPESLLMWMRDAADREDGWRSDEVDRSESRIILSDNFSEKINNLKQEMKWLRSADVRILRQLVAVHEGIEAMRWLMEERDALVSRGSSLTGSLSSLVTVEEPGPFMSPCRENLSPTQNMTEPFSDECADHQPLTDHDESNHRSYCNMLSSESTEARPSSPSTSTFEEICFTQSRNDQLSSSPANCYDSSDLSKPQPSDSNVASLRRSSGDTIRRALLRSSRVRREVRADSDIFTSSEQSEEKQTEQQTQESFTDNRNNTVEEEESAPDKETMLLGYDAQWCWVESQDDVTFL
ncbi:uncharacterized protein LOC117826278 [Notolabrus celidotus]|uniref:uncharacterized protein LOC117826278 n=1 Tax=Notolabrus celidotus TaxID=1203425 RepID=UPI00148F7FC1|nr:uncharacterized protein LOC117826278 [Notolabrus celidotus]